jgi:cysteine-rich repeat protein
MDSYFPT